MNYTEINHPLIQDKLATLRDSSTHYSKFRNLIHDITVLMLPTVFENVTLSDVKIQTPMISMNAKKIAKSIIVVPILRAGLGMSEAITQMIPKAKVGHIGVQRNSENLQPEPYYFKMPPIDTDSYVVLVDPMLATGGSMAYAIQLLKEKNVKSIKAMSIIAAPEGIKHVNTMFPDVELYSAAIDSHLDENAYIVPGLGDAGDRIFGTEH